MQPRDHRKLERVVGNSSHPFFAAPGEAEGEQQARHSRSEWLTPEERAYLAWRADNMPEVWVGMRAFTTEPEG